MPLYHAPTADFQFLLKDWLGLDAHYQKLGIGDFDSELASEIIAQGAKFALDVVAPLNREGDEEGGCAAEAWRGVAGDGRTLVSVPKTQ